MAKPWKKKWPHLAKSGQKSYQVGFRDHDGIERTKSFPVAKLANEWIETYIAAERRGNDSLRRFLLDLDAKEASGDTSGQAIGEVIQLYFAFNVPDTADGLATSTFRTYRHSANRHLLGRPGTRRGKPLPPADYAVRRSATRRPLQRTRRAARPTRGEEAHQGGAIRPRPRLARPLRSALLGRELRAGARGRIQRLPVRQREDQQTDASPCAAGTAARHRGGVVRKSAVGHSRRRP
jgi:hypothetical protein